MHNYKTHRNFFNFNTLTSTFLWATNCNQQLPFVLMWLQSLANTPLWRFKTFILFFVLWISKREAIGFIWRRMCSRKKRFDAKRITISPLTYIRVNSFTRSACFRWIKVLANRCQIYIFDHEPFLKNPLPKATLDGSLMFALGPLTF
jgi:hypothetical protein